VPGLGKVRPTIYNSQAGLGVPYLSACLCQGFRKKDLLVSLMPWGAFGKEGAH